MGLTQVQFAIFAELKNQVRVEKVESNKLVLNKEEYLRIEELSGFSADWLQESIPPFSKEPLLIFCIPGGIKHIEKRVASIKINRIKKVISIFLKEILPDFESYLVVRFKEERAYCFLNKTILIIIDHSKQFTETFYTSLSPFKSKLQEITNELRLFPDSIPENSLELYDSITYFNTLLILLKIIKDFSPTEIKNEIRMLKLFYKRSSSAYKKYLQIQHIPEIGIDKIVDIIIENKISIQELLERLKEKNYY